jgi:hypothetical protein
MDLDLFCLGLTNRLDVLCYVNEVCDLSSEDDINDAISVPSQRI